jgi:hypothetical protein
MYGDPTAIRRLAGGLRERATDIRAEADRLVARTDAAGWLGRAGDALRRRVRDRAGHLRRSAVLHDDAADRLDKHAREVERRQRLIEEVERRVRRLDDAALDRPDDWPDDWLDDELDDSLGDWSAWLDRFEPPPPGSPAWLDVDLPRGLR